MSRDRFPYNVIGSDTGCPDCCGTGNFQGDECELCEGLGVIDKETQDFMQAIAVADVMDGFEQAFGKIFGRRQ